MKNKSVKLPFVTKNSKHLVRTSGDDSSALIEFTPQPRSQGLSSLPPLVVGIKTLVAAGHVITQNLGGKKIFWAGGVAECFDCCCGKLCGFQNLEQSTEQSLKTTRFIGI